MRKFVTFIFVLAVALGLTAEASARGCRGGRCGRLRARQHHPVQRVLQRIHVRHRGQTSCAAAPATSPACPECTSPAPAKTKKKAPVKRTALDLEDIDAKRFEQIIPEKIGLPTETGRPARPLVESDESSPFFKAPKEPIDR